MNACMHVHIETHTHTYAHKCMHVCMGTCLRSTAYRQLHAYLNICSCKRTYIHAGVCVLFLPYSLCPYDKLNINAYEDVLILLHALFGYMHTHTHAYIHTHTYIHTYIHTQVCYFCRTAYMDDSSCSQCSCNRWPAPLTHSPVDDFLGYTGY